MVLTENGSEFLLDRLVPTCECPERSSQLVELLLLVTQALLLGLWPSLAPWDVERAFARAPERATAVAHGVALLRVVLDDALGLCPLALVAFALLVSERLA